MTAPRAVRPAQNGVLDGRAVVLAMMKETMQGFVSGQGFFATADRVSLAKDTYRK
jgi:hypothetical protein